MMPDVSIIIRSMVRMSNWLRTSWSLRAAFVGVLAICLPLALVWPQYLKERELPETINFVPQDADWFVFGRKLTDFTALSQSHLLHIRSTLDDGNGWPTEAGYKRQRNFDFIAKSILGGWDYTTLHCLLSRDEASLSKSGLNATGSMAIFRKDNRTRLVLPVVDHRAAAEYLAAALTTPTPSVVLDYDVTDLADRASYSVSLKTSAKGYLPCAPPRATVGTNDNNDLTLQGTVVTETSARELAIKLVPLLNSNLTEVSTAISCSLSDGTNKAPCGCKLKVWDPQEDTWQSRSCTASDALPLPQASINDIDWDRFDQGLPVAFGDYSVQKLGSYIVISILLGNDNKWASLDTIDFPSMSIARDKAFQASILTLQAQTKEGMNNVFGGIRPTVGMTLQKELGIPAIPLYLTTPFVLSARPDELAVSLNINLAPQDMELLKLIASKSTAEQSIGWRQQAGSGIQLTFNDPSLRSYPKLLNSIFPEFDAMLQSKGRVFPVFLDLLDNGVSAVSFASLKKSDNLSPVAIVASQPKSDLAGVSRLLEGLSRQENLRRKEAILAGMRQYFQAVCILMRSDDDFDDCVRSIIQRDLRRNGRKVEQDDPEVSAAFSELACLPKAASSDGRDLVKALSQGDSSAFGDALLGSAPTFEPEANTSFPTSVDAGISPAELVWSRGFAGTEEISLSAEQTRKETNFEELISSTDKEEKDDERLANDLQKATQLLWTARQNWSYLLDDVPPKPKTPLKLTESDLDGDIRLWLRTLEDSKSDWSTKRATHERLAAWNSIADGAVAQGDEPNGIGMLKMLVSLPILREIRRMCERAKSDGALPASVDQQLQVASIDAGGPEFGLVFYQFGNRELIKQLEKSLARTKGASKLSVAMDGTAFLSSEKDAQSRLEEEGLELPYRFLTVNLDGLESRKGLIATLSLVQGVAAR